MLTSSLGGVQKTPTKKTTRLFSFKYDGIELIFTCMILTFLSCTVPWSNLSCELLYKQTELIKLENYTEPFTVQMLD